jgi:hypothetical protein
LANLIFKSEGAIRKTKCSHYLVRWYYRDDPNAVRTRTFLCNSSDAFFKTLDEWNKEVAIAGVEEMGDVDISDLRF